MIWFSQYYIRHFRPALNAFLTRLLYAGRVQIGKGFKADAIPRIIVDKGSKIIIGKHVEFRRGIELRAHGKASIHIGDNNRFDRGIRILATNGSTIKTANGVRIGLYSVLNGGDSITIGEKSLVSGFVYLQTSMHAYASKQLNVQDQGFKHAPIHLAENTWLGTHVVVLPGVNIGNGAIVGSNAVVNKSVEPYQIVGGIPAKIIKQIN
jgi:acetyltransferase-like isoleucine patch superfamily enzyme